MDTMKVKVKSYDVGVIVGRFQVPELHEVHRNLIKSVCDNHQKVILYLGMSPLLTTINNPLDFESRKQMILEEFPDITVLYIRDVHDDERWSKNLDEQISHVVAPHQSVVLYGGRDSFIEHYEGKHDVLELESEKILSGTEIRKEVSKSVKKDPMFRRGWIHAAFNRFPTCYPTVDIAIFDEEEKKILLGRKEGEPLYRLPGGFADPRSTSYEADARREAQEETGVTITDPAYIGSFIIDDWRYRNEPDKIKTLLFKAKMLHGPVKADDDLAEVKWFDVDNIDLYDVMTNHRELLQAVLGLAKSER